MPLEFPAFNCLQQVLKVDANYKRARIEALRHKYCTDGTLNFFIAVYGDYLANREGYKTHQGLEAVHYYLVERYRWLPSQVKAMSLDDIRFVLRDEMEDWPAPPEALEVIRSRL